VVTRIVITIDTDDRLGAPRWVAQIIGNRLSEKNYIDRLVMSVNGGPVVDPRQVAWGMDDAEFAAWTTQRDETYVRVAQWNEHCVQLHSRRRELEAQGVAPDDAWVQARAEHPWDKEHQ